MRKALPALALCGLSVVACSGGSDGPKQPSTSAFADGTCRVAAPDVLAIGKTGAKLGNGKTISGAAKATLKDAQDGLRGIADGAEPTYKPALQALVESTGFVRIRADGNSYDPSLGERMLKDYRAVLTVCGAGPKGRQ